MPQAPKIFRITLQVDDLERAATFYTKLLGVHGRPIRGARHYFQCGDVILAVLDPTEGRRRAKPLPECIYFAVSNLASVHARAKRLRCLSKERVHGESAGAIVTRPWGERSFYAEDPFGNPLCFVDAKTLFTGE